MNTDLTVARLTTYFSGFGWPRPSGEANSRITVIDLKSGNLSAKVADSLARCLSR
jgi:hypothetical protein